MAVLKEKQSVNTGLLIVSLRNFVPKKYWCIAAVISNTMIV